MQDTKSNGIDNLRLEDLPKLMVQLNEKICNIEQLLKQQSENTSQDQLLSIEEASSFLRLSRATIYSKVSRRELPFIKKTKRLYFSKEKLTAYLMEGGAS